MRVIVAISFNAFHYFAEHRNKLKISTKWVYRFLANVSFFNPLKTSESQRVFLVILGGKKWEHSREMG